MKWLNQFTNKSNGLVSKNISMETTQTILDKNAACRQPLKQQINLINESQIPTTKEEKPEMIINRKKTLENKNMNVKQAAIIIQSNWRGYSDRMKIKRMNESIGILQRHFRERQLKKLENEQQIQLEKESQIMITKNRHKRYCEKLETEIKLWSSLPGCLVENEWNKERELAAISIQRYYRGYYVRKYLKNQRDYLKRDKAARIIQLNFRKYLSRIECASSGKGVSNIDSIENNLINNKKLEITMKKVLKSQTRQVTLTRMKIDADLLLNEFTDEEKGEKDKQLKNRIKLKKTTALNEIVDKHIENSDITNAFSQFTCRVQPLTRLARMEHHDKMIRMNLNKSWWNIFMDEWRQKQDEYILSYNKNCSNLIDTNVTNLNVDNDDLSWLPDRFIEELESRDIFQW
ncbi:IQ calmodulin-binding motif [Schistosoma haematobium]|uniref:IQ calmodulin-binding motif n=1 Tax=Schistosoma haematobium TaxID=6185 RepID=A0A922LTR3_SCHHA|nr:IQ calmodulin-binding motif [Schistosoma haematobium]KAH9593685.1 IQ calmodulin-binding motif [Schistosoma haematobium]